MASSSGSKTPCSKCGYSRWVLPCDGCHESFCVKHAGEHRIELTTELDKIQEQYDHLQHMCNQHEKRQEHPLFSQIDVWEHDTIGKIQQTAQTARDELRQLLDESNNRMKTIFNQFNDQLKTGRQTEDYTEIELNQWKEQLINIRKELETPCDMELIPDNNLPPIHLIKVNTTKQNTLIRDHSFSQVNEGTNNIECSCDDELEKSQSSIPESNTECLNNLEENKSRTTLKEDDKTNLTSCDTQPIDRGILLDPTKDNHFVFLQLSSASDSQVPSILKQLIDSNLQSFDQEEECLNELNCSEQTTIFIDLSDIIFDEQRRLLDNISGFDNVYFIYIRGIPSENDNERDAFFKRYSKIKAMFENEQRLMVQWAIDTANEYKKMGDIYVRRGDKENGRKCFEHGVTLYKRLSVFLNEKRRVR